MTRSFAVGILVALVLSACAAPADVVETLDADVMNSADEPSESLAVDGRLDCPNDARFRVNSDYDPDASGYDTPAQDIGAVIGRYVDEGTTSTSTAAWAPSFETVGRSCG